MKELLEQMEAISYKVNRLCDTADLLERCDLERDMFVKQVFSGSFQLFNEAISKKKKTSYPYG